MSIFCICRMIREWYSALAKTVYIFASAKCGVISAYIFCTANRTRKLWSEVMIGSQHNRSAVITAIVCSPQNCRVLFALIFWCFQREINSRILQFTEWVEGLSAHILRNSHCGEDNQTYFAEWAWCQENYSYFTVPRRRKTRNRWRILQTRVLVKYEWLGCWSASVPWVRWHPSNIHQDHLNTSTSWRTGIEPST